MVVAALLVGAMLEKLTDPHGNSRRPQLTSQVVPPPTIELRTMREASLRWSHAVRLLTSPYLNE